MGTVRSLNPATEISDFLSFLYGEEEAYVHLPVKDYTDGKYEYDFFFKWPEQRQAILDHVLRHSKHSDVFITPGMFKSRSSSVAESHGSYTVWADFDGNVPDLEELREANVPEPTLVVQSSKPGHEHWYWRFEQFNNDVVSIQGINKAIAYALNADNGCWDVGHSTRPVGSHNHKRNAPVTHKRYNSKNLYRITHFEQVEPPQEAYNLEQFGKEHIPDFQRTVMKYGPWDDDTIDLVSKDAMPKGSRSSAMARLAYECAERGLDNSEIYSVISTVDLSWKKYSGRLNPEKYYVDLINHVRQKVPYEGIKGVPVLAEGLTWYGFRQILSHVDTTEWLVPGYIPTSSNVFIVGRSGVGKSTLALGFVLSLCLNKEYLDWKNGLDRVLKVLFVSLDMPSPEHVQLFFKDLANHFTEEELDLLEIQFETYASPEKIKFYQPTSPTMSKFIRDLESKKPDLVLVDSAVHSLAPNLSNQEEVSKSLDVIDQIRERYKCTFFFITHARKDPPGHGYRESDLDDMFGSAFIAASASCIIAMKESKESTQNNTLVDIRYLKTRYKGANIGLTVKQTDNRWFERPHAKAAIEAPVADVPPPRKNDDNSSGMFAL